MTTPSAAADIFPKKKSSSLQTVARYIRTEQKYSLGQRLWGGIFSVKFNLCYFALFKNMNEQQIRDLTKAYSCEINYQQQSNKPFSPATHYLQPVKNAK